VDPSSGTASLLELTRSFGELLRQGIRPKRSIVICSWDGEEYALTGSTEWGEQYADELKKKAVAYLNVDEAASGKDLQGDAVGSRAPLLVDVTRTLPAPSGKMLYDEWRASRQYELHGIQPISDSELPNTRIGSGSDHTVFLNFLGIPTVGLTFVGPYGVYHSMYDDFYWTNHFADPGYRYNALMSELWGVVSLRLLNAEILPFDFATYGASIRKFISSLDASTHVAGKVDLVPLEDAAAEFESAGRELNESRSRAIASGHIKPALAQSLNDELIQVERNWCNPSGIPGRPWWKHQLYGARYTYAHLELPGLTEAAEVSDWAAAAEQAKLLKTALAKNTELLQHVRGELDSILAGQTQ